IQALVEPVLQGLVVATTVSAPGGTAKVDQAIELCATQPPRAGRRTLGADLGYDQRSLITGLRALGWTPHIAQGAASILDGRTTRHAGHATSQQRRKRVEESFGWSKTVGPLRKLRHRGLALVD
nr:transposase [Gemmatimonadales bacterium]